MRRGSSHVQLLAASGRATMTVFPGTLVQKRDMKSVPGMTGEENGNIRLAGRGLLP